MNQATIIGRLGRDAEVRYTPSGKAVTNFTVATSERWTDKGGQRQEKTEWHRVVLWDREKLSEYLRKGTQVMVQGSLQTRKWEDRNGTERYTTEINGRQIELLGSKRDNDGGQPRQQTQQYQEPAPIDDGGPQPAAAPVEGSQELTDDDIPF